MSQSSGEPDFSPRTRALLAKIGLSVVGVLILFLLLHAYLFGPANPLGQTTEFIVEPESSTAMVAKKLKEERYIKSEVAFVIAHGKAATRDVRPGGYRISSAMDTWYIAETLGKPPYLAWIKVTPGMRKEEIADLLVDYLGWTDTERDEWLRVYTAPSPSFTEGVYYPDTYLLPSDLSPKEVAERMRARFQEVFAPYANEAAAAGKDWTDVVNLAAIVEREAAKHDKELVAGILWNRIERDMPLQADATLQYIKGTKEKWWPVPRSEDKFVKSPFNTYQVVGLPPHPIANPSLDSIRAVINPDETNCIYYLHDYDGQIHCSLTYAEHKRNVTRYLK